MEKDTEIRHIEIEVPAQKEAERIDKFLTREIANISRTRVQQLIEMELIQVDGRPVKASRSVVPGEKIEIYIPGPRKTELIPQDIPLDILYEDPYLLVLNKPAGMVVHPAVGHPDGTLVNALLHHCGDLSGINGRLRPGIVHRLDKDTSGLMVIAKDDMTHQNLSKQFSDRTITRHYIALAWGHLKKGQGRIETFYGRSPKNRKKMAVLDEGKIAITDYKVLEELPLLSVVQLKLATGRTHQIRVHLAHLGHPVFSDYVYGGRNRRLGSLSPPERKIAARYLECLTRQALHAQTLGFIHPHTEEELFFTSELPEDMKKLLDLARNTSQFIE